MVEVSHQEKQTHGLLTVELPEVVAPQAAVDQATDSQAQEAEGGYADVQQPVVAKLVGSDQPLMTKDTAIERLGPAVMAALTDNFKGSLTDIRHPDEDDMLC